MKSVSRLLALFLALSIVLTVFKIPFPVLADASGTFADDPIIVKPFTEWESQSVASKSTQTPVTPLDWTNVKGLKLSADTEYTNDYPANSLAFARYKTDGEFVLGDAKYVIMYIKTDSANTILPTIGYEGALINTPYDPLMSLGVGKSYSYMRIGSDCWTTANTIATWKSASGDTNGDGISDTYFGGMRFNRAFEGYIKFAIDDLSNDNARINRLDRKTTKISQFNVSVLGIGGQYGTVTAGPIFLSESQSNSVDLITPEVEVAPFENFTVVRSGGFGNSVYPIDGCNLMGETLDRDLVWDVPQTQFATLTTCRLQFSDIGKSMADTEGFMFYLSVPKNTTTTFVMVLEDPKDTARWNYSYPPALLPLAEEKYYFLNEGDSVWQSKKLVYTNENGSKYRAGIYFETGFSGYVKIPYSSLGNDSGFKLNPNYDIINSLTYYFDRFGGEYGQVIAGPNFFVLNDGTSEEITIKDNYSSSVSPDLKGEITVLSSNNGAVSVDKKSAYCGEKVKVSVTAEEGYALKADGLSIEYADCLGNKKQSIADYKGDENVFVFDMPKTKSVTLKAKFVTINEQNFTLFYPKVAYNNSLEFKFREFKNSHSSAQKGVLIALYDSLQGNELTANLNGVDIINATLCDADNTFTLQGNRVYSDFTVRLNNIKPENLRRNYVVRGYQLIDGEYCYTEPVVVNHSDACGMLSDYTGFPEISLGNPDYRVSCSNVNVSLGELDSSNGIKAEATAMTEQTLDNVRNSYYWFTADFAPTAVSNFHYIGIYIKVPALKDNILYLNMTDSKGQAYQIMPKSEYILISKANSQKVYGTVLEGGNRYSGVVTIPAGFEGLLCLPVSSFNPHNTIKPQTELVSITYRFGFIGKGENAVVAGPVIGFKQTDRMAENKELIPQLPAGSSYKINTSATEMMGNTAVLYWDNFTEAENYLIKAYKKVIGGYLCVSQNVLYSNSGSLSGLTKGEKYILTLCARDKRDNILAEYLTQNLLFEPSDKYVDIKKENIVYDSVDYTVGNVRYSPFVNRSYTTLKAYNSELLNDNPNRGFRGCIDFFHFNLTDAAIKAEIENDIKSIKNNGFNSNVYVCYLYPGDYLGKDLSEEFFATTQKIFDYFRANKMQILLRFAYFDVNNFNQRTPTTEEILHHINQLSNNGIIERNKEIIHSFQVGFAGKFGEWHSDTPESTRADRYEVLNAFVEKLLPDGIFAQLRMPNFKDFLSSENLVKYGDRFGFHLDSFYGIMDGTELGSGQYSYGCDDWERHIAEASVTPNDAEAYYWSQFEDVGMYPEGYASAIAAAQLRLTTFSAINGYLDQNINASGCVNEWKKVPITENWLKFNNLPVTDGWVRDNKSNTVNRSVYDYIKDYLGYRISAKSLSVTESQKGMKLSLDLVNYGFSAAFNISSSIVILDGQNNEVYSQNVGNPAEWYGTKTGTVPDGKLITYNLTADMEIPKAIGSYRIALKLVSNSGATARLDNNIPYENGYNILHSFMVTR